MASRAGPAGRVLGDLALADHACASLVAGWARAGGGRWPAWRAAFTGAGRPGGLARDVPGLLGYRHFLAALADLLDVADPDGYLRLLLDHAGTAVLLVDPGPRGEEVVAVAELGRAAGRPA